MAGISFSSDQEPVQALGAGLRGGENLHPTLWLQGQHPGAWLGRGRGGVGVGSGWLDWVEVGCWVKLAGFICVAKCIARILGGNGRCWFFRLAGVLRVGV